MLSYAQRQTLSRIFDDDDPTVTAPIGGDVLSAYLVLFGLCGPLDDLELDDLDAEPDTIWDAGASSALRPILYRTGSVISCPGRGTRYPPIAA